jgi:ABC-2 type transport system permease protein
MKLEPGSWPWLLGNELRLTWRGIGGGHFWFLTAAGGLLWFFMHWGAWVVMPGAPKFLQVLFQMPIMAGGLYWLFFSLLVSQTMANTVTALIERGDLDLLLSSPLPQRAIFLVRGLSIALGAALLPAFALLPLAHAGLFRGVPGLMAVYPVVLSTALGCTAAGMLLVMTLLRLLGARRAKTAAQIMAAVIGGAFFLLFQLPNFLPAGTKKAFAAWLHTGMQNKGLFGPDSAVWWPIHAMAGEPLPLLAVMAVGIGGFFLAVNLTYRRFITGTQETVTGGRASSAAVKGSGRPVFRAGLVRVLLLKEWKLVLRDMQVISQSLLQLLYLIPLLLLGFSGGVPNQFLVPGLVAATAMLAGNLAWITINAEDAPELVATAPVPVAKVLRIKAAAAALPVLAALLPLAVWWAGRAPWAAARLLLCGAGGIVCASLIQIWNPHAANRRDLKNRMKQGGAAGYIELLSTVGWVGIAACAGEYWRWLPLAAGITAAAVLAAWHLGRAAREEAWG